LKEARNRFFTQGGGEAQGEVLWPYISLSFGAGVVASTLPPLWFEALVRVRSIMYNVCKHFRAAKYSEPQDPENI
jgi:hypothetical protein